MESLAAELPHPDMWSLESTAATVRQLLEKIDEERLVDLAMTFQLYDTNHDTLLSRQEVKTLASRVAQEMRMSSAEAATALSAVRDAILNALQSPT